jgi:hypothetical protein
MPKKKDPVAAAPAADAAVTPAAPAAPAVAPAPAAPAKIVQNGITRPKAGTATGRVWDIADEISREAKAPAPRKGVLDKAVAEGINPATAATQYVKWCRFFGVEKPKPEPKPAKVAAPAVAPAAEMTPTQIFQAQPFAVARREGDVPPDTSVAPV